MKRRIISMSVFVLCGYMQHSYAPFADTVSYAVTVGANSSWGIVTGNGSVADGACDSQSLVGMTITNNNGAAGTLSGTAQKCYVCPSLSYGVSYWNPASVLGSVNLCALGELAGTTSSKAEECQGITFAAIGATTNSAVSSDQGSADESVQVLLKNLEDKYVTLKKTESTFPSQQSDGSAQLYAQVKQQLDFLGTVRAQLTPDEKKGHDFLSVPYLKFCAVASQEGPTGQSVNAAAQRLFGSVDVASYFPDQIFSVVLDMTAGGSTITANNVHRTAKDTERSGGPLVRAFQAGLIDSVSSDKFLQLFKEVTPLHTQTVIKKQTVGDPLVDRAVLEEVLFTHAGLMLGVHCIAGVEDPSAVLVNEGSFMAKGSRKMGKMSSLPQLCGKLSSMARYVRVLYTAPSSGKAVYNPQPIDTFYGVIVINQGRVQEAPVFVTSDNVFDTFIPSKFDKNAPFSTAVLKVAGGVDVWNAAGVNEYSGLKYRAVSLRLTSSKGTLINASSQIRVQEGSGGYQYKESTGDSVPVSISLVDTAYNLHSEVSSSESVQQFFAKDAAFPWAVIVHALNETGVSGTVNAQPTFKIVGLARLNPLQYGLSYLAHESGSQMMVPFTTDLLVQAPFVLYNELVFPDAQNARAPKTTTQGLLSADSKSLSIPAINQHFVKYKGVLQYKWATDFTMQDALIKNILILKKQYLTADQMVTDKMLSLLSGAGSTQDVVSVETKTIQLVSTVGV